MAPATKTSHGTKGVVWRPTKIMNMRDLSKDDDFLSHLLVEKLGTGVVPLLVHKMDPSRHLPKTNAEDLLHLVRRNMVMKTPVHHATRQAVDELLTLPPIRYYLKSYTQKQINAFATHASRYFELYHPTGSIEISHTSRYSHRTGKSELCILATRPLSTGTVISELKGSMANLTEEEDMELKRTDIRNSDIRRDFSVIHSKQMKKNHLFLGPARFVNHDCNNNCELFREGKYITFRVIRPIAVGEEITAHYGDGYFGRNNSHCLCETCEKSGRGGYAPAQSDDEDDQALDSDSAVDSGSKAAESSEVDRKTLNLNERRTRRGVYAIVQEEDDESDESDEDETNIPLAEATDVPKDEEIELEVNADSPSPLTSVSSSRSSSKLPLDSRPNAGLLTPDPDSAESSASSPTSKSSPSKAASPSDRNRASPFTSIISTRRQKALAAEVSVSAAEQVVTPPLTDDTASLADASISALKRVTRSSVVSSVVSNSAQNVSKTKRTLPLRPSSSEDKGKEKEKERPRKVKDEPETRILRARPSASTASESPKAAGDRKEVPRGCDGKPLPTCSTCSNILPVISVDSKVVWGLGVECSPRKGKKPKEQDCPRCMRHFAIYAQPWPSRAPEHVAAWLLTPRECTPVDGPTKRVSLSTLDRKLSAAVSSSKLGRQDSVQASKKRKVSDSIERSESNTSLARSHGLHKRKPWRQVALMSCKPSKLTKRQRKYCTQPPRPARQVARMSCMTSELPKRKRGRPRLTSPRRLGKDPKIPEEPKAEAAPDQPREINGRFGKKGFRGFMGSMFTPNVVMSRAQRAIERDKVKAWLERRAQANETEEDGASPQKRCASHLDADGRAGKRIRRNEDDNEDVSVDVMPRFFSGSGRSPFRFKGMGLLHTPNPMSFARRSLVSFRGDSQSPGTIKDMDHAMDVTITSDDETDVPETPEDKLSAPSIVIDDSESVLALDDVSTRSRVGVVDIDEIRVADPFKRVSSKLQQTQPVGALTFKPSPFNFARRRWVPTSVSPNSTNDGNTAPESRDQDDEGPAAIDAAPSEKLSCHPWSRDYDSSGEEDIVIPESPDPSKFVLQHRASFGSRIFSLTLDGIPTDGSGPQPTERLVAMKCDKPPTLKVNGSADLDSIPLSGDTLLCKSSPFLLDVTSPPPTFVNAGWDSCSDTSAEPS